MGGFDDANGFLEERKGLGGLCPSVLSAPEQDCLKRLQRSWLGDSQKRPAVRFPCGKAA
jgi:hypothetical protein